MTREEAITRIKDHIDIHRYREQNAVKICEALEMAIKALEQPEPYFDEIIVLCDNCGHAINVKRVDVKQPERKNGEAE